MTGYSGEKFCFASLGSGRYMRIGSGLRSMLSSSGSVFSGHCVTCVNEVESDVTSSGGLSCF